MTTVRREKQRMQTVNENRGGGIGRTLAALVPALALALAAFAAPAQAEVEYQGSVGGFGGGAGQLNYPMGIGVNNQTGNFYVAERRNHRISEFTESLSFVRAWGYDVVASGEGNKAPANEVQQLTVLAGSGFFTLTYQGSETDYIPSDADPSEVEDALNALPSISAGGGSVSVTGGPGSLDAGTPYRVTFDGGPLAGTNLNPMTMGPSNLGQPQGTTKLFCRGQQAFSFNEPEWSIQWMANGVPIPGETGETFTPGPEHAGKAIQCEVTGHYPSRQRRSNPNFAVIHPAPSTPIPEPPAQLPFLETSGPLTTGSAGGQTITCKAGNWKGNPTSYTYEWFRNDQPIGTPVTTTQTSNDYVTTPQDVEIASSYQCRVTATSAGGSAVMWSNNATTTPAPGGSSFAQESVRASAKPVSRVGTYVEGGAPFEVCEPNETTKDVCKAGVAGTGIGQLNFPTSVAVDNSPGGGGAIWVAEKGTDSGLSNRARVQKFSADGSPILVIGFEVNESNSGHFCTVASGHACGSGPMFSNNPANRNLEPGSFAGAWPEANFGENPREVLDVDPEGNVYVSHDADGDDIYPRIQKFGPNGEFLGQVRVPPSIPGNGLQPLSVAVDSQFRVFTSTKYPEIEIFQQSDFTPEYDGPRFAERTSIATGSPQSAIAADPTHDYIWGANINQLNDFLPLRSCNEAGAVRTVLMAWDAEGHKLECSAPTGLGELPSAQGQGVEGLAVSASGFLYASTGNQHLVKKYKVPQPTAPEVVRPSVRGITMETAKLGAVVQPGFLATDVTLEYGTEPCSANPCTAVDAGKVHGLLEQFPEVTIEGLEPGKRYFYRVVAENAVGEDVSADRTFTTHTFVDLNNDKCENVLVRKQTGTGALLDCRAYELASASFSGGFDVVSNLVEGDQPLSGSPRAPGKLLYTVDGGIPGTGNPTNKGGDPYVSVRTASGWTTKYVGIPSNLGLSESRYASTLADADSSLDTFAFGGDEICDPCFPDGSSGIPVRLPDGRLVQGLRGSIPQPGAKPAGFIGRHLSADGRYLVFGTTSQLEPEDTDGGLTIYKRDLIEEATEVISTDPSGDLLTGADVGALDMSDDGSRVLVGTELDEDAAGNIYWHPYLHLGTSSETVDLAPGASAGVLFNGMTADGSRVFFTTVDQLDPADTDDSADLYEATVDDGGSFDLRIVSVGDGGPVNDDSCTPAGLPNSWNHPTGDGKCGPLAFAGEAGLASESGTFYFLSPELLDGSQGTPNQANLYVVHPGDSPEFVATIDTSEGKPGPGHWTNELGDADFTDSSLSAPKAMAVDRDTGDLYVLEAGTGKLSRFDSTGAPKPFAETGTHQLSGFTTEPGQWTGVAVDNSGGPTDGMIFVTRFQDKVDIFNRDGKKEGELDGTGDPFLGGSGGLAEVCGVAVDQSNGDVYMSDAGQEGAGVLMRYQLKEGATFPLSDADYTVTHGFMFGPTFCAMAADEGRLFAAHELGQGTRDFEGDGFGAGLVLVEGSLIDQEGSAVSIDPVDDEVYVNVGNAVNVYKTSGGYPKVNSISGGFSLSEGVAVNPDDKTVYVQAGAKVRKYDYVAPPYRPLDHPALAHAEHPAVHHWGDFQVTPDGSYAAFATRMPLDPDYDNAGFYEVYRHDSQSGELVCTSCVPTEGQPSSDSTLPQHGLGLTDDGRVFFNTGEQLVLRDTNQKLDAYEWSPPRDVTGGCQEPEGCQQLISSGTSIFESGMLGVSADGADAFFFTREKLVEDDFNGEAMKVYDARENGGFFKLPQEPPCAAADECRGAATQAAPPPQIGTFKGRGGQAKQRKPKRCRKGFVKRRGKCVKKRRARKKAGKKRRAGKKGKRTGSSRRGGNR